MCKDTLWVCHTLSGRIICGLHLVRAGIFVSRKFQSQFFFPSIFLNKILNLTIKTIIQ